jgi:GMP synthase (glutamine-hydrolysing)
MILIIDNSLTNEMIRMTNNLSKILLDLNVPYRLIHSSENYNKIEKLLEESLGVILTGSEISYSKEFYNKIEMKMIKNNMEIIKNVKIPILGICFGFHSIANFFENKILLYHTYLKKKMFVNIDNNSPIFYNLPPKILVYEHHGDYIEDILFNFPKKKYKLEIIAYSNLFVEGIQRKKIYGVQFHPEASGKVGKVIILNFINICYNS